MEQTTTQLTAGAVRAELARQRRSGRELGRTIGWSLGTTSRRLNGQSPITVDELARIAAFLGLPLAALLPVEQEAA